MIERTLGEGVAYALSRKNGARRRGLSSVKLKKELSSSWFNRRLPSLGFLGEEVVCGSLSR